MADITAALQGTILEFDSSGFDATRVHAPTVTKVGDSYVMLYAGLPFFNNIQIGLATSDDGQIWTKYSSIPVISNGSSQPWASFREVPATLLYEDGLYKLWFSGSNRNLATDPGFGSGFGYATSPDGTNWTFASDNPIRWELNSPSGNGFGLTEVVSFGGQYHAYFVDRNPTGDILYHATSSDGVHFSGQTAVGIGSGYVLEAATTVGRAVLGVWSNGGARYYGRSTDGVNFTIEGAIQNLAFDVNDVRIDGGTIEFYGTAGVGNINWSFGNAVIQHATATLPNSAPQAVDDLGQHFAFNAPAMFSAAGLLANDTDAEHDPLSIIAVSGATHGSVVLNAGGNPVFTPAGNYSGAASFSYTISDGHGSSRANVQFTVDAPAQVLIGGPGNDSLIGSAGNDRLSGSDGADVLVGNEGNDWMSGGRGHDVLFGGTAADTMLGGADNDIYYVDNAGDVVIDGKNAGTDEVRSSINYVLGSNVENLTLNGAVNGTGNKLDNHITGSDDANVLGAGIGRDVLEGGRGDDILTGGRDWDLFVFKPHFGHDIITDFAVTRSYSAIGPDHDVLVFDLGIFADAASLLAHSLDTADGVLVTADAGDSVLLKNTTLAALQAHPEDFHFI
jgi:Ca2+-binding RTX toxin-like protein